MDQTKVTDLYTNYALEVTDAPKLYAEWLSYLVLSCVVNKHIYMDYGGFMKIYPNLYLLIIGPSSVYRKSFSQKLAWSFVRQIYPDFRILDFSSQESFISELARDRIPSQCGLIMIDELSGLMKKVKTSPHFSNLVEKMSSAFDADDLSRRIGVKEKEKEVFNADEPFLNITAACSFDWLTASVETSDLTGGFLARFLWVVAREKEGEHWAEAKRGDAMKRTQILDRLNSIKDVIGEISWTSEAKEYWEWWYSDFRKKNQGGRWDANYERMTNQVRKIAMLNAAQQMRLTIQLEDLYSAAAMAEPLVAHLNEVAIGDNPEEILRQRILQYIKRYSPACVTKSELLNNISGIDKRRLEAAIETLVESDKVTVDISEKEGHPGRRPTKYKIKEMGRILVPVN